MEKREKYTSDIRPAWAIEVDKELAVKRITKKQLSADLGLGYRHVVNITTGVTVERSNRVRDLICGHLGIEVDGRVNHVS